MKIIGFTYLDGRAEMVLRCDSCLLNGGKPFFLPDSKQSDGTTDVRARRAVVLRVSRLGKSVQAKFANRYYDAWAPALDIIAWDKLQQARSEGHSWTEAIGFDYSLPIGEWVSNEDVNADENADNLCISPAEAIEQVSHVMTIRQGDLIYIDCLEAELPLTRDNVIEGPKGYENKLYCKIK